MDRFAPLASMSALRTSEAPMMACISRVPACSALIDAPFTPLSSLLPDHSTVAPMPTLAMARHAAAMVRKRGVGRRREAMLVTLSWGVSATAASTEFFSAGETGTGDGRSASASPAACNSGSVRIASVKASSRVIVRHSLSIQERFEFAQAVAHAGLCCA